MASSRVYGLVRPQSGQPALMLAELAAVQKSNVRTHDDHTQHDLDALLSL